jgi:hypothetical protein
MDTPAKPEYDILISDLDYNDIDSDNPSTLNLD